LGALGPTHRGYVERANFVVLRSPDVPSILVETAFITNPTEERKLRDPAHREQLASAILKGVRGYFEDTPPPGTWFAAVKSGRVHPGETDAGTLLAAARDANAGKSDDAKPDDDGDAPVETQVVARKQIARNGGPRVRPPASDSDIQVASEIPPAPQTAGSSMLDARIRDMHRVMRGETLSGIAQQYGVSISALRSINSRIPDDGSVKAGQVLLIPSS
ncbi:MAG TPA: LysM peptidoglycan-binding domain-containing protein, partial [Rhodanobacteraceae bacterium]|nr:LysM peptidoglycan-binding domain-containing protein [Rhodanobacteraceae bacterium]